VSAEDRAWVMSGAFGFDHLELTRRPRPEPGPGEVLVQVEALSLNYRDLLLVQGRYDPRMSLPRVPLSDAAGVVVEVGAGCTRFQTGDRVSPIFAPTWHDGEPPADILSHALGHRRDGVAAEHVVFPEADLVALPAGLDFIEAATLPCAGVTAWHALTTGPGAIRPGDTVLVQGTGGVSLFALQLARLSGARVIVTSSDDEKLARARTLGAELGINYRTTPQWGKAVRAHTAGRGADHIVEVGGAGTLAESLAAVRAGGRISIIGVLAGRQAPIDVTSILMRGVTLQGIFVGSRAHFEGLQRAVGASGLRPVVDRVFDFEALPAALAHLETGRHFGKIALRLGRQ
jgi:NADPH:quinone reductase-like Zn-dependent oxidoreductase